MRKLILIIIIISALLTAGCSGRDTDQYTPTDTNHQYETAEPEQSSPSISAASQHTLAVKADGTLWSWGNVFEDWEGNRRSLIGDGTTQSRSRPVQIMEDVVFAAAGHDHSFAITTDGALWAWGSNQHGQLGDGTTEHRLSPVKIMDNVVYVAMPPDMPNAHTGSGGVRSYAIRSDGTLWAWGLGSRYYMPWDVALGDGYREDRHSPVQILENVISVVPSHNGGFAITDDGRLWHWHGTRQIHNQYNDTFIEIEAQLYPAAIMENVASISPNIGFVITTGGELWRLSDDEPTRVMNDVVYATGANGAYFAITTDRTLLAWGQNRLPSHWRPGPVLGDGTTADRDSPVVIMENAASVIVMGNNAYVIGTDGALWEWGMGALHSTVEDHMWEYALDDDSGFPNGMRWLLDDDGGTGIRLSPVKILENVVSVAPTYSILDHGWISGARAFALTECGSVWAWGENDHFGQGFGLLGDGTSERRLYPVRIIDGE